MRNVVVLALCLACAIPAHARLYGLRNPGDGGRQLVEIDPATGAVTPISASVSPPLPGVSGCAALDEDGHRFFFTGTPTGETDSRLYTIDTVSGAILSSPVLTGSASAFVEGMAYDDAEDVLYAVRNPGDGGRQIVSIDPATGAITPISASISPPLPSASGVDSLDDAGNRYFFVATPTGETDSRVYTVDTATGAVLSSPAIVGSAAAFINGLEWDPIDHVLYGVRNPGDGGRQVISIDPATGAVTPISASISPPLPSSSAVNALDASGNRLFFIASPPAGETIYTVDTTTGAVISSALTGGAFFAALEYPPPVVAPPVLTVTIDIRPAAINVRASGVIPVVIFSTPAFDATAVDVSTVRFGPGLAIEAHGIAHIEDADGDGDLDVVLHFRSRDAAIPCGSTSAMLTATTSGGQAIQGTDTFTTVGCR